ncbi:endonuclease/exonuclease/phosphatase family protein [Halosegnis marinus]|uniref:endonuclease/exonuclease/phosphatase family protein n=1 Tax=Halosegnis marinus TaxID=3034023 RepID=UPI0036213A44
MPSPTRRGFLRAAAGATPPRAGGVPDWLAAAETTVATQNVGLGVRLYDLVSAERIDPDVVAERFARLRRNAPGERMAALASTLAAHDPAVVGVQEAALVERDGEVVADFLDALVAGFEDAGADYRVAAVSANADVTLPASTGNGTVGVRLLDRDALLVRDDVAVGGTRSGTYAVNASTVVDGERFTATRGYCFADLRVRGVDVTAGATHLASANATIRRAQAGQLRERLPDTGATVLLADLNSRPESPSPSAYGILGERLGDAWAVADGAGPTCCQFAHLGNERSFLSRRVDYVLVGGPATPLHVSRTLTDPEARIAVGDREVWPADHAGVVARLRVGPALSDPLGVARAVAARLSGA